MHVLGSRLSLSGFLGLILVGAMGCDDKTQSTATTASSASGAPKATASANATGSANAMGTGAPATTGSAASAGEGTVTLLITADEDGHLLPSDGAPPRGGAAELMGKWIKDEGYCAPKDAKGTGCETSRTIALSTGDHASGPAISTYFLGESTAEVMGKMGYAASALGNHELDFGDLQFAKLVDTSHVSHLAANMHAKAGVLVDKVKDYVMVERGGAKIAVVGLAGIATAKSTMAGRFEGVTFDAYETALGVTVPKAWKDGADAVVVLAHECPEQLEPVIAKHADWHVSLVAGAHCAKDVMATTGATKIASCGRHFEQYLRATLKVDKTKPAGQHVTDVNASRIDVTGATADANVKTTVDAWKKKLDAQLSEEIGFAQKGYAKDAPELAKLFLGGIRKELHADVALVNKQGFRGALGAGPVTRATVYSTIPYENAVLLLNVPGEALLKQLAKDTAVYEGFTGSKEAGFKDANGKPVDPKKSYKLATLDFLYFGGDGFELASLDPSPQETGMVWQTAVIDYLKKHKTTKTSPLEDLAKK